MHVTVTKEPDGVFYMTKDGFGVLFDAELDPDTVESFGDNTVEIVSERYEKRTEEMVGPFVHFSWVDYMDTSARGTPGEGVRHTHEQHIPCSFAAGPYTVRVADADDSETVVE